MQNENKITKETIIRTIVLVVALVNQILTMTGHSMLPFTDAFISEFVSTIITVIAALVAWWKNNSFTKPAIEADQVMRALKKKEKDQNGQ